MYIIIVGGGEVGTRLARYLFSKGLKISVIENDKSRVEQLKGIPGVNVVAGNGAQAVVLEQACIKKADLLVAVTSMDEVNIIACMLAKKYYVPRTVCRLRGDSYLKEDPDLISQFGIDIIINPEKVAAGRILTLLQIPEADEVEYFARGRVMLLGASVSQDAAIAGTRLCDLPENRDFNIVGIRKPDGKLIIPGGGDRIAPGSKIYLLGKSGALNNIRPLLARKKTILRQVVILGGGAVGRQVALLLEDSSLHFMVKLIEKNRKRCQELNLELQKTLILHGDATEIAILKEEEFHHADAVIAVTSDDQANIVTALLARQFGIKKIICKVIKTSSVPVYKLLNLESLVNPRLLAAAQIIRLTRPEELLDLSILPDEMAEVFEIVLPAEATVAGREIKKAHLPRRMIIGSLVRGEEIIIPGGETVMWPGDHLVVFASSGDIKDLECFFAPGQKAGLH